MQTTLQEQLQYILRAAIEEMHQNQRQEQCVAEMESFSFLFVFLGEKEWERA